jgi:hypothetical protein
LFHRRFSELYGQHRIFIPSGDAVGNREYSNNNRRGWGQEYVVKSIVEYSKSFDTRIIKRKGATVLMEDGIISFEPIDKDNIRLVIRLPVIVRVRPNEQDVTLEVDTTTLENKNKNKNGNNNIQ